MFLHIQSISGHIAKYQALYRCSCTTHNDEYSGRSILDGEHGHGVGYTVVNDILMSYVFESPNQSYSLLKVVFRLGGSVERVWDEMECWFRHHHQQAVSEALVTDFVTSIETSQFSPTSGNTNNAFCKFHVWLTIWEIIWIFINGLIQWAICHSWKHIAIFTMQSFFCWAVYIYIYIISLFHRRSLFSNSITRYFPLYQLIIIKIKSPLIPYQLDIVGLTISIDSI